MNTSTPDRGVSSVSTGASWRRIERALRSANRSVANQVEARQLSQLQHAAGLMRLWSDPRVRLRAKRSDARVEAVGTWTDGALLEQRLQTQAADLYAALQRHRMQKMRASKSSFGSASVTLVLLSVLAAGIIAFLGYSGFQLIRQESGAAESARRSVDEHRAAVESSPDAILVVDLENRITLANSRTAELFGFATAAAMLGMNIQEQLTPADQPRAREGMRRRLTLDHPGSRGSFATFQSGNDSSRNSSTRLHMMS